MVTAEGDMEVGDMGEGATEEGIQDTEAMEVGEGDMEVMGVGDMEAMVEGGMEVMGAGVDMVGEDTIAMGVGVVMEVTEGMTKAAAMEEVAKVVMAEVMEAGTTRKRSRSVTQTTQLVPADVWIKCSMLSGQYHY